MDKKLLKIFWFSLTISFVIALILFKIEGYQYSNLDYSTIPEAFFHSLVISLVIILSINKKRLKEFFICLGVSILGEIIWYGATANKLHAGSGGFVIFAYIPLGILIGFVVPLIINPLIRRFYLKEK